MAIEGCNAVLPHLPGHLLLLEHSPGIIFGGRGPGTDSQANAPIGRSNVVVGLASDEVSQPGKEKRGAPCTHNVVGLAVPLLMMRRDCSSGKEWRRL